MDGREGTRTERWTYMVGAPKQKALRSGDPAGRYAQHAALGFAGGSPPEPFSDQYAEYQLYDLYADPHQVLNLAGRDGTIDISENLRQRLLARMQEAGDHPAEIRPPFFPYS